MFIDIDIDSHICVCIKMDICVYVDRYMDMCVCAERRGGWREGERAVEKTLLAEDVPGEALYKYK